MRFSAGCFIQYPARAQDDQQHHHHQHGGPGLYPDILLHVPYPHDNRTAAHGQGYNPQDLDLPARAGDLSSTPRSTQQQYHNVPLATHHTAGYNSTASLTRNAPFQETQPQILEKQQKKFKDSASSVRKLSSKRR